MAPAKFDDLCKTAKDVLSDDYTDAGKNISSFKSKMKTNFEGLNAFTGGETGKDGATLTTAVDINVGDKCATPAKLTWKFPNPVGIAGISFDKLEMDKSGKQKLEAVVDLDKMQNINGVKFDFKSDLSSLGGTNITANYTGIANALVKCDVNVGNYWRTIQVEASYAVGSGATVGLNHSPESTADLGLQYVNGPAFFSAMVTENFAAKSIHGFYKVSNDFKVACNYNMGAKKDGQWAAGVAWDVADGTNFKGKITGKAGADLCLSTAIKQTLAKGVTMTAGTNVPLDNAEKSMTWGLAFNVE